MNETKFISDSAARCVGNDRSASQVMGDTPLVWRRANAITMNGGILTIVPETAQSLFEN
jgi:hypothetical protein